MITIGNGTYRRFMEGAPLGSGPDNVKGSIWIGATNDTIAAIEAGNFFLALFSYGLRKGDRLVVIADIDGTIDSKDYLVSTATASSVVITPISELDKVNGATVTIGLAASATTDGMDITITVKDAAGQTVAAVHQLEIWMSENSGGAGLTGDAYSGDLTATTGAILSAHTAKKHWSVATAASGIFAATLVDSANPADQYVAAKEPRGAKVVVSAVSGTNWEGA